MVSNLRSFKFKNPQVSFRCSMPPGRWPALWQLPPGKRHPATSRPQPAGSWDHSTWILIRNGWINETIFVNIVAYIFRCDTHAAYITCEHSTSYMFFLHSMHIHHLIMFHACACFESIENQESNPESNHIQPSVLNILTSVCNNHSFHPLDLFNV